MFLRPQTDAFGDRLTCICAKLANLRADLYAKVVTDKAEVLTRAYGIEAELVAWLATLPSHFSYTTVEDQCSGPSSRMRSHDIRPYNDRYHIYGEFIVCNVWNQYRSARILNNQLILDCLRELSGNKPIAAMPHDVRSQCRAIRGTIQQLAADVCASVPCHFGSGQMEGPSNGCLYPTDTYVGGLVILWPLFLAGMTEGRAHPMRKWVSECLEVIGHTMGIDQSLALMEMMGTKEFFENE